MAMYDELIKRLRETPSIPVDAKLHNEAADAIEDLDNRLNLHRQGKIGHWIPVTERLPEKNKDILAIVHWINEGDDTLCFGHRKENGWFLWNSVEGLAIKNYEVTYWMPLPEPPKDGEA